MSLRSFCPFWIRHLIVIKYDIEDVWHNRLGRLRGSGEEDVSDILFLQPLFKVNFPAPLLICRALAGRARVAAGNGERYPNGSQVIVKSVGRRYSSRGTMALRNYVSSRDGVKGAVQLYDEFGDPLDGEQAKGKIRSWPEGDKRNSIHSWHLVWSLPSQDVERDRHQFRLACRNTVDLLFTENGYEVLWGIHEDKPGRLHAHIILCAHSMLGRKWRFDKHGDVLDTMRAAFAHFAVLAGFKVNASRREDRPAIREKILNGEERLRTARTYLTWKKGSGKPDVRAPNWFAKFGKQQEIASDGKPGLFERIKDRLFKDASRHELEHEPVAAIFAPVFIAPIFAARSFAHMAQETAGRSLRPSSFVLWNLRNRPDLFGPLNGKTIAPEIIMNLVRQVRGLHVIPGNLNPMQPKTDHAAWLEDCRNDRQAIRASLNRLADLDEAVNQGDTRAKLIRVEVQRIERLPLPSNTNPASRILPAYPMEPPHPKQKRQADPPASNGGASSEQTARPLAKPESALPARKRSRRRPSIDRDID